MICWLIWGLLPSIAAADTLAERIRDAQLQAAALRAVEESIAVLSQRLSEPQTLVDTLLGDPAEHRYRSASMARLRAAEYNKLYTAFAEQLARFARHLPELPPDWVERTLNQQATHVDATLQNLLAQGFAERYVAARTTAVRQQARSLAAQDFYPRAEEVEALLDIDRVTATPLAGLSQVLETADGQRLIQRYAERIAVQQALFEENRHQVSQRVRGAITEQIAELQAQLSALQVYQPQDGAAIDARSLQTALLQRVQPTRGHTLFPAVRQRAGTRAAALEKTLFLRFIARWLDAKSGCLGLPPVRVRAAIGDDYRSLPSDPRQHVQQLRQQLARQVRQELLEAYAERLADTSAQADFRRRLRDLSERDAELATAFDKGIDECLLGPLREARSALASAELAARRPRIANASHELNDADLQHLRSASDLNAVTLEDFPSEAGLHLQESRTLLAERRRQLKREGRFAIDSQFDLVTAHRGSFSEQIRQDPDRKRRREYWQQSFESLVLERWRALRDVDLSKPDGHMLAAGKYERVFESTARFIADILPIDWEAEPAEAAEAAESMHTEIQQSACDNAALCRAAANTCYQALASCSAGGDCNQALARCSDARSNCAGGF